MYVPSEARKGRRHYVEIGFWGVVRLLLLRGAEKQEGVRDECLRSAAPPPLSPLVTGIGKRQKLGRAAHAAPQNTTSSSSSIAGNSTAIDTANTIAIITTPRTHLW